jgi:hypothetical protein
MGTGASLGARQYSAKFSFDLGSANCATDFVTFHTGLLAFSSSGMDALMIGSFLVEK